jgi:FkbM family methyltransferase
VIERYGCRVHAFDPTPRSVAYVSRLDEPRLCFHAVGLWSSDTAQHFRPPTNPANVSHSISAAAGDGGFTAACRSVPSLMSELGHDRIDLLKLDIEGAEYDALSAMFGAGVEPRCVAVEFHGGLRPAASCVRSLRRRGYVPVAVDGWDATFVRR